MSFRPSLGGLSPCFFSMNTTIIQDRIQEDWPVKPGHCLNPFEPLFGADTPESELGRSLYDMAISIEEAYGLGELIDELPDLVLGIKRNLTSWYEIGLISWKIKLCKGWRKRYTSFKQFCENAIGKTSSAVNNWIRAARVMSHLISAGCDRLPMNASIALELSKFSESDLIDAWRDICETYADHELTLDKVKSHLENPYQRLPNSKKVNISLESWEKLREKAAESGMSPSKLLEELIDSLLPDEDDSSRDTVPPDEPDEDEPDEDEDKDAQDLPNFAKRYRANFRYQDNYYSPVVNSYLFDNGKLVPF
jgi:hypothetical protein